MENKFDLSFNQNRLVRRGDLLLAEPFMRDQNFERSVVLICEHLDEQGSFGLILNKPAGISVEKVTEDLYASNPLFVGGPVEQNTLHFIHKFNDLEGAVPLKNGLFWGGDYEQLKSYAAANLVKSDNCRFFMGYSGWASKQLAEELKHKSWIVADFELDTLFEVWHEEMWSEILKKMGGKFKAFANYPADPRMN